MQNEETKTLPTSDSEVGLLAKLYGWLKWILVNAIGAYIIYLALFENKGWAVNVTVFCAHLLLFFGLMIAVYVHEHKDEKAKIQKRKKVPVNVDIVYDLLISILFASQGWFYTAVIWFLQIFFESYVYSKDDKPAV